MQASLENRLAKVEAAAKSTVESVKHVIVIELVEPGGRIVGRRQFQNGGLVELPVGPDEFCESARRLTE